MQNWPSALQNDPKLGIYRDIIYTIIQKDSGSENDDTKMFLLCMWVEADPQTLFHTNLKEEGAIGLVWLSFTPPFDLKKKLR